MYRGLIFLIFIFNGLVSINGQSSPFILTKCWQFDSSQTSKTQLASDNAYNIYLPQTDSSIISLNKLGQVVWSNEIGGNLISDIKQIDNQLVFVTGEEYLSLKSIGLETGLTIWKTDFRVEGETKFIKIFPFNEKLLLYNGLTTLVVFSESNGAIKVTRDLEIEPDSDLQINNNRIYFLNRQNQVVEYLIEEDKTNIFFQSPIPLNSFKILSESRILIIDKLGGVTHFDLKNKKKTWFFRTGGNIDSIVENRENLLISSLDNYIYYLSSQKGKLVWKKRMEGRVENVVSEKDSIMISNVVNTNLSVISEIGKGRTLNQITLPEDDVFISKPIIVGSLILFSTNKGILAFSLNKC